MATISTSLRNFKEPTKEELTHIFFSIPSETGNSGEGNGGKEVANMDISAVLSLGELEDSYVGDTCCEFCDNN